MGIFAKVQQAVDSAMVALKGRNEKLVIVLRESYYKALDNDILLSRGAGNHDMNYHGMPIKVKCDHRVSDDVIIMTYREYDGLSKKEVMYHRLMTNGEWFAEGKSGKDRIKVLEHEAEGFASMCSGYDHWKILVNQYVEEFKNATPTLGVIQYKPSDLTSRSL